MAHAEIPVGEVTILPLLFPIARAFGVHEVHYAMIIMLAMGIRLFAPPFGVGYYALLVGLIIVAIFPWISIGFL